MKHHLFLFLLLLAAVSCGRENRVVLGDERFDEYLPLLEGKRVAILSNHSGIVGDKVENWCLKGGQEVTEESVGIPFGLPSDTTRPVKYGPHMVDVLLEKGVDVCAIFSPEHGFRGTADAGEQVASGVDEATGIPILSLYEDGSYMPSAASMGRFDLLVVDIQDVGLRYYTYYITMQHLMDACAVYGKKVVILDRPNPNGFYVDGPILDMQYASGIGSLPVAMVHGMTLGELALMMNGEGWLKDGLQCDLTVIPCLNYTHQTRCTLIVPPSPNLKDMRSIYLYSSTCFFEGTNVTAGRGTQYPFEIYGHPLMENRGFSFTPRSIPGAKHPRYQDQLCYGVDLRGKPLREIWDEQVNMEYLIDAYNHFPADSAFFMRRNHFELQIGVSYARQMVLDGAGAAEISARWAEDVARFKEQRRPYLLYKE
ncbi:MAG: DUF1343 domain-containing protein [Bacteroidales bacterium]|nr:DUF1343 domain-containing protein [Bacteroidales bacterium]